MKKYTINALVAIMAMASAIPMGAAAQTLTMGPIFSAPAGVAIINTYHYYAPGVTAQQITGDLATPVTVARAGLINGVFVNQCVGTPAQCYVTPAYNLMMRDLACKNSISIKSISRSAPAGSTVILRHNGFHIQSNGTVVLMYSNDSTQVCP